MDIPAYERALALLGITGPIGEYRVPFGDPNGEPVLVYQRNVDGKLEKKDLPAPDRMTAAQRAEVIEKLTRHIGQIEANRKINPDPPN